MADCAGTIRHIVHAAFVAQWCAEHIATGVIMVKMTAALYIEIFLRK